MRILRIISDESGQVILISALCMVIVISFLGLAIDVGHLRYVKRTLQTAADASALAAGLELRICAGTPNCAAMQTAAQNSLTENGLTGSVLITNCASGGTSTLTVMVNNAPCALGASDPNNGNVKFVEVVVSEPVKMYFTQLLGLSSVNISARAEAKRSPGGPCIYALDPTGNGAITVGLLAGVVSTCGVVDESNSSDAFACVLGASLTASSVNITGGEGSLLCAMSPKPTMGVAVPNPADPLSYLPKPTAIGCGHSTSSPYHGSSSAVNVALGNAVFYPDGAYCGGINIGLLGKATFEPGTYVLKSTTSILGISSGGLSVSLGSTVTGTGVTFYNYGPKGSIAFLNVSPLGLLGTTTLTAPTSGTYGGILFFQDPQDTDPAGLLLSASTTSKLEGAYYFPNASVDVALSGPAAYNYLVAKDIGFTVLTAGLAQTTLFSSDYSTLDNTSPLGGDNDVLVQ